jgi:ClpP class serine protease
MAKAFEYLASRPWAIRPELIEVGVAIASRQHEPGALEAKPGKPHADAEGAMETRDGVAIIPVMGPIFRYADWFTSLCGGTTTAALARDLATAVEDPSVKAILLHVDSGGGEATGIAELAAMVRAATDRKPVVAYVGGDCCSAAYWIASGAGEIVVAPTAIVGSIGVVWAYPTKKDDPRRVEFVSSQSPHKRPDPQSETGRSKIQQVVDDLAAVFVAAVAENRDVSPETVLSDFGGGGLLVGQKAVAAGMADRIGSFEEVLAELAEDARPQPDPDPKPARASGQIETQEKPDMSWKEKYRALMSEKPADVVIENEAPASTETKPGETIIPTPVKPSSVVDIENDPRYKALADRVGKLSAVNREAAKAAFLSASTDRLYPANADQASALFAQAQADDETSPLATGSRVAMVEAFVAKTPKHNLSGNAIPVGSLPGDARSVGNDPTTETSDASKDDELLAMTPAGRAILAAEKAKK